MALNTLVSGYQILLCSHQQHQEWQASILLLQKNNTPFIDLRFVAEPEKWLNKGKILLDGISIIYVDASRYSTFVDLLRNETPLNAILYSPVGTVPTRVVLQTGVELAGEGE